MKPYKDEDSSRNKVVRATATFDVSQPEALLRQLPSQDLYDLVKNKTLFEGCSLKDIAQLKSNIYGVIVDKEGGISSIDAFPDDHFQERQPKDIPLIVRAAFNKATNLYSINKEDSKTIFKLLARKGYAPAAKFLEESLEAEKLSQQRKKQAIIGINTASDLITANMKRAALNLLSPETMAGIFSQALNMAREEAGQEGSLVKASSGIEQFFKEDAYINQERKNIEKVFSNHSASTERARAGDIRGALTAQSEERKRTNDAIKNAIQSPQEILEQDLFDSKNLQDMRLVAQNIADLTEPNDVLVFIGRSPLYFNEMLQSLDLDRKYYDELPFSYGGTNCDLFSEEEKKNYALAEEHYIQFLKYRLNHVKKDKRVFLIDRYESGNSVHKFRDLLEKALGIDAQIIALCGETNNTHQDKASHDPRVAGIIIVPLDFLAKTTSNETEKGLDGALGRAFSWSQWLNWKEFIHEKPPIGNVALARKKQIKEFRRTQASHAEQT